MRKMKSKPNVAIIDEAIRRIKEGVNRHSCVALSHACEKAGGDYFGSSDSSRDGETYRAQYRLLMTNSRGKLPSWWDVDKRHTRARVAALKKFKAACIAAGAAK